MEKQNKVTASLGYISIKWKVLILSTLLFGALFVAASLVVHFYFIDSTAEKSLKSALGIDGFEGLLLYIGIGFLVAECLLLASLWSPMSRLRRASNYLPWLAKGDMSKGRRALLKLVRPAIFKDESDWMVSSAINLAERINRLQTELMQRAEVIEARSLELEHEKDFVTCLLDTAHALISTMNGSCQIRMMNRHGETTLGRSERDLLGSKFMDLFPYSETIPDIRYQLEELFKGKRNEFAHESEVIGSDERRLHLAFFHSRLPSRSNSEHAILTVALDISQRKQAEEHLGWLASHDPLTGLYNRRRFTEDLERIILAAERYKTTGAVLFFDLDQFKDVNDTSGHHVGDDLLKRVARTLKKESREVDIVARLGGDEFAMILLEATPDFSKEVAQRLCTALNKIQVQGGDRIHRASSSIGIAIFPQHGSSVEELLGNADVAMYQAKEAGRNGWHLFEENEDHWKKIKERVYWNEKIKKILQDDSFELYFQPIMSLQTGSVSHFEVLLRIFDEGESVSAKKFMHYADKAGKLIELDQKIITRVFQCKHILERNNIHARLAINLSGISFRSNRLFEHVNQLLETIKIRSPEIIFEITETTAVGDVEGTRATMDSIRNLGCRFSLDDFGVGVSSFYHLKQFPFDYVKIDGAFIKNIKDDMDDQVMVRALVEVAQAFGQYTIAESVESEEIMELLGDELHVDYAQGNFIAAARPFGEIWEVETLEDQLYELMNSANKMQV